MHQQGLNAVANFWFEYEPNNCEDVSIQVAFYRFVRRTRAGQRLVRALANRAARRAPMSSDFSDYGERSVGYVRVGATHQASIPPFEADADGNERCASSRSEGVKVWDPELRLVGGGKVLDAYLARARPRDERLTYSWDEVALATLLEEACFFRLFHTHLLQPAPPACMHSRIVSALRKPPCGPRLGLALTALPHRATCWE